MLPAALKAAWRCDLERYARSTAFQTPPDTITKSQLLSIVEHQTPLGSQESQDCLLHALSKLSRPTLPVKELKFIIHNVFRELEDKGLMTKDESESETRLGRAQIYVENILAQLPKERRTNLALHL